jgi:mitosis inhibitor protein kinase SWE1
MGEATEDLNMQQFLLSGVEKSGAGGLSALATTSSPLKRSDGIMNLDQASLGSPLAKRRSLHGASFGSDFDIFDHAPHPSSHFDTRNDSISQDSEMNGNCNNTTSHSLASPIHALTRRSSSLRKSTLQQRYVDKPSHLRPRPGVSDVGFEFATPGPPTRVRGRVSLDSFMPPASRESPFSQGSLPSASVHMISQQSQDLQHVVNQPQHQPHPLSRAITNSSSGSSLGDLLADSPTHAPMHAPAHSRPITDFTKSLPVGVPRPLFRDLASRDPSGATSSTESSFATPQNYRAAKPLPLAFMSTGLISKRNRNPDDRQVGVAGSKAQMPDTPCKRPSSIFSTVSGHVPEPATTKTRQIHHEFGTPSTPFNPHATRPTPGTFGKGVSVFGSGFARNGISRRGSFVSVDGDEISESPSSKGRARGQSLSGSEFDLPPTPTKQPFGTGGAQQGNSRGQKGGLFGQQSMDDGSGSASTSTAGRKSWKSGQSCKSSSIGSPSGSLDGESDVVMDDSPTPAPAAVFLLSPTTTTSALACSRMLHVSRTMSSTPVRRRTNIPSPLSLPEKVRFTKTTDQPTASPLERRDNFEQVSPRTPQENILPPDPSGLSISARGDGSAVITVPDGSSNAMMLPPATPTAGREYFAQFQIRRPHITPINGFVPIDMDESLTSRFNKVELIGTGEFSQVYRVTQSQSRFHCKTKASTVERSPQTSLPDRVFAVKKSRSAYSGTRDRLRKLQEVTILKALGQSDHIVQLIDSWEEKNHLYMQTEFCEEGSLDLFLAQVGRKARLDDFRIWKILLELSLVGPSWRYCF